MANKKSKKDRSRQSQSFSSSNGKAVSSAHAAGYSGEEVTCTEFLQGEFKKSFINQFMSFKEDAAALAAGKFANSNDWKEKLAKFGLGTASVLAGAGIAALGAAAIISAVAASVGGIVVAVVGIAIGIAVNTYMDRKKKRQFGRVNIKLQRGTLDSDIALIADSLANLYSGQLAKCTRKDAVKLAEACFSAISDQLIHNKSMSFNELLHPVLLQGVLMRSISAVPKKKLELIMMTNQSANTQSMISKAALYCQENDKFYSCPSSKPGKYGALMFTSKKELKEYKSLVMEMQKKPEKWKYKKMSDSQAEVLREEGFFKQRSQANDEVFEKNDDQKPIRSFSA